jgi:hypothetical protein
MSLDTSSRPRIQQVIEALAAACGLEQPEIPSEAPGLVLESAEGFLTLILPHPEDSTRLTVDIEAADASTATEGMSHAGVGARALQALFELGGALEERSHWRLGLNGDAQFVLSAVFELDAFADTDQALAMLEDGAARASGLRAAWDGLTK